MLNTIVEFMEKGIVVLRDFIINFAPSYGDYILLVLCLFVSYLIEQKRNIEPYKVWIPLGVIIFLLLKFAGG